MVKLITASEVISKAFTNSNTDTTLIKDGFIEIAQYNQLKPIIGEDLYNKIISEKNEGVTWKSTIGVDTTTGSANLVSNPGSNFTSDMVNWYVQGTGVPLFKDGYTSSSDENNHYTKVITFTDTSNIVLNASATLTNAPVSLTFYSPIGYLVEKYILDFLAFAVKFEVLPDMTYNSTSQGIVENVADFTTPVDGKKLSFLRTEILKQAETYKRRMIHFLCQEDLNYPLYEPDDDFTVKRSGLIMY